MGYGGEANSVTAGIHMRQFARAFIIDDNLNRVVFVNVDCQSISQLVKSEVKMYCSFIQVVASAYVRTYTVRSRKFVTNWDVALERSSHIVNVIWVFKYIIYWRW